jgi:predicted transcriptional regulator
MKTDDDAVILIVVRTEKRFVEVGVVFRDQVLLSLKDSDESRKLANTLATRLADALDIDMKEYTYRIMNSQVFWNWEDVVERVK